MHLPAALRGVGGLAARGAGLAARRHPALVAAHAQRRQYGEGWLRNLVKVHVNITNAADPSFWSWRVASYFPMPDAWMRDHRKIVFYDITEDDPYRGEAIFTGAGIGEHYANLSWEDRSLLVRGPAVLGLKAAARDILARAGDRDRRGSRAVLQPRPSAPDYDARVRAAGQHRPSAARHAAAERDRLRRQARQRRQGGALHPHAGGLGHQDPRLALERDLLGIGAARVRAARRARAGHRPGAGQRAGAAPSARWSAARELAVAPHHDRPRVLAPEIAASGGLLKVGIFATELHVTDIAGKARRGQRSTLERHPWLHELFAFPDEVYPALDAIATTLGALADSPATADGFESYERSLPAPQGELLRVARGVVGDGTRRLGAADGGVRADCGSHRCNARPSAVASFAEYPDALRDVGGDVLRRWYDELPPETRRSVVFFTDRRARPTRTTAASRSTARTALVISRWPSVHRLPRPHHAHRTEPVDRGSRGARRAPPESLGRHDAPRPLVPLRVLAGRR